MIHMERSGLKSREKSKGGDMAAKQTFTSEGDFESPSLSGNTNSQMHYKLSQQLHTKPGTGERMVKDLVRTMDLRDIEV